MVVGEQGESLACTYLRSIGYSIRGRNIRIGHDEIDVIAHDPEDDVLVFVEVKTRTKKSEEGFSPEMTATATKRRKIQRCARRWIAYANYDGGYRMDLVCVQENRVTNHFKEIAWL
jgi:putative endonuclease